MQQVKHFIIQFYRIFFEQICTVKKKVVKMNGCSHWRRKFGSSFKYIWGRYNLYTRRYSFRRSPKCNFGQSTRIFTWKFPKSCQCPKSCPQTLDLNSKFINLITYENQIQIVQTKILAKYIKQIKFSIKFLIERSPTVMICMPFKKRNNNGITKHSLEESIL